MNKARIKLILKKLAKAYRFGFVLFTFITPYLSVAEKTSAKAIE